MRALEPEDVDLMFDVENDDEVWNYSDTVAPFSRRLLRDYASTYDADPFSAGQLRLIMIEKNSGQPAGIIDLYDISQRHKRAFIGIYVCKDFRGKRYGEEALELIEEYAYKVLHLHQLAAKVEEKNLRGERLFLNCGYKIKGVLKDWLSTPDGNFTGIKILTKIL